jgi:hypothetical protein
MAGVVALRRGSFVQQTGSLSLCWGWSVAKMYCVTFGHGDRFAQWPLPLGTETPRAKALVRQIPCKVLRQIICKVAERARSVVSVAVNPMGA